jgi:hypothetical protein
VANQKSSDVCPHQPVLNGNFHNYNLLDLFHGKESVSNLALRSKKLEMARIGHYRYCHLKDATSS